ncbi:MAG: hypothetical protein JOZ15_14515 [Acidobacteria bacterium]|nr:hypothetical protein [Acidobacteriota bacterium]
MRSHRSYRLVAGMAGAALLAVAVGCTQAPAPRSAAAAASPRPARPVEERPIGPGPELPKIDVVPSQGTCAPEKKTPFVLTACCNGKETCNGQCVRGAGGEVACACFDTAGGCREGQVCCRFRRACTALQDCAPPE